MYRRVSKTESFKDVKFKLLAYSAAAFGVPAVLLMVVIAGNTMCLVAQSLGFLTPGIHVVVN